MSFLDKPIFHNHSSYVYDMSVPGTPSAAAHCIAVISAAGVLTLRRTAIAAAQRGGGRGVADPRPTAVATARRRRHGRIRRRRRGGGAVAVTIYDGHWWKIAADWAVWTWEVTTALWAIEGGGIRTVGRSGGGGLWFDVQVVCWDLKRVRAGQM
jgi:hypothetical protein